MQQEGEDDNLEDKNRRSREREGVKLSLHDATINYNHTMAVSESGSRFMQKAGLIYSRQKQWLPCLMVTWGNLTYVAHTYFHTT